MRVTPCSLLVARRDDLRGTYFPPEWPLSSARRSRALRGRFGDLFGIDVAARATFDLGRSLRDIALLHDGTLVLRIRLERDAEGYLHEEYCFSTDAKTCNASVRYTSPVPQRD